MGSDVMRKVLDVFEISKEVDRDSKSGKLNEMLKADEQTLYGINPDYPEFLERTTSDGQRKLGQWRDGEFIAEVGLFDKKK